MKNSHVGGSNLNRRGRYHVEEELGQGLTLLSGGLGEKLTEGGV